MILDVQFAQIRVIPKYTEFRSIPEVYTYYMYVYYDQKRIMCIFLHQKNWPVNSFLNTTVLYVIKDIQGNRAQQANYG